MMFPSKEIRQNSDITHIVIHHTQDFRAISGKRHNNEYLMSGAFGSPYDILIEQEGKIGISPQWLYALDGTHYKSDVSMKDIMPSKIHHYAQIGRNLKEKKNYTHVALIGDFDIKTPTAFQLNALLKVLEALCTQLKLCVRLCLLYQSELRFVSSPGILFPEKEKIIQELLLRSRVKALCEL